MTIRCMTDEIIRNKILELLRKEDSLYINQIKRLIGLKNSGHTWYHVKVLEEKGLVELTPTLDERDKSVIVRVNLIE